MVRFDVGWWWIPLRLSRNRIDLEKLTERSGWSWIDERQTHQLIEGTKRWEISCRLHKCIRKANRSHLSAVKILTNHCKKPLWRIVQMNSNLCSTKKWKNTHRECVDGIVQREIFSDLNQNLRMQCNRSTGRVRELDEHSCWRSESIRLTKFSSFSHDSSL